jgi:branched-chain amino acid transport system permease protein
MEWLNTALQGLMLGGVYALYGLGLSLIFGVMRLVNLAHGDFIVLSGYIALLVTQTFGLSPFASLLIVVPVMFVLGYALQKGLLERFTGQGQLPPLLVTFGLSIIIQNVLLLTFGANQQRLNAGDIEAVGFQLGPVVSVGALPLLTFGVALLAVLGMQLLLARTAVGRALRATSDDPGAAELLGVDSRRMFAIALGLSLALVALAGVLLGIRTSFAPTDGPIRLIFAFEAVIIGGLGSLWGTFIGGLLLGVVQGFGASLDPGWFQLSGHLFTLLVLVVRPSGLFARTRDG